MPADHGTFPPPGGPAFPLPPPHPGASASGPAGADPAAYRPPWAQAPGWYAGADGQPRWWHGHGWVALSPGPSVWAPLSHASIAVLPVIAPLIVRLTVAKQDEFVRHHASEALNAQLLQLLIGGGGYVAFFLGILRISGSQPPPWWAFVGIIAVLIVSFAYTIMAAFGAVRSGQGRWWRYPIVLRIVPGAVREGTRPDVPRRGQPVPLPPGS